MKNYQPKGQDFPLHAKCTSCPSSITDSVLFYQKPAGCINSKRDSYVINLSQPEYGVYMPAKTILARHLHQS